MEIVGFIQNKIALTKKMKPTTIQQEKSYKTQKYIYKANNPSENQNDFSLHTLYQTKQNLYKRDQTFSHSQLFICDGLKILFPLELIFDLHYKHSKAEGMKC